MVTTSTAQRWADDRGMPLFETSAKDDSVADHVDGIFLTLAHKLREGRAMIEPLSDPSNPDNRPVSIMHFLQTIDIHLSRFEFCTQAVWQRHLKTSQPDAAFDQAGDWKSAWQALQIN